MSVVLLALASTQAVTGMGVPTANALLQRR